MDQGRLAELEATIRQRTTAAHPGYLVITRIHDRAGKLDVDVFKGHERVVEVHDLPVGAYLMDPSRVDELVELIGREIRKKRR